MSTDPRAFRARLDALIGKATAANPAPDEVNLPMIHHWVAALGDANPVYTDARFAAGTRFGGLVAPPAMLQVWTMQPPKIEGILERGGVQFEAKGSPLAVLDEAGFTGTIATNSELEFHRYLRLGDRLASITVIEAISDEKTTALGAGHFVTWVTTWTDAAGEVVGRQRFRILKFKPKPPGAP